MSRNHTSSARRRTITILTTMLVGDYECRLCLWQCLYAMRRSQSKKCLAATWLGSAWLRRDGLRCRRLFSKLPCAIGLWQESLTLIWADLRREGPISTYVAVTDYRIGPSEASVGRLCIHICLCGKPIGKKCPHSDGDEFCLATPAAVIGCGVLVESVCRMITTRGC